MSVENLDNDDQGNNGEVDDAIVAEASELGWVPLEKFKGDQEKWVDAQTFVERGKHIMPILRKNNEKLRNDLLRRDSEIGTLRNTLAGMGKTLERLENTYNEGLKKALTEQKADLRRQLAEARKDGDVDTEVQLEEQLEATSAALVEANKPPAKVEVPASNDGGDSGLSPEFIAWKEENPWFGEDKKKTKAILRAAEDLREEGVTITGAKFFEMAAEVAFKDETPAGKNKVEVGSPRNSGTNNPSRNKGFSGLPKEAQDICMQDVEALVGPNKKFKEVKDWQAYYTKLYYGEPV